MEPGQLNASFIWGIADDVLRDLYVRGKYRDVILPLKSASAWNRKDIQRACGVCRLASASFWWNIGSA